ncbi:Glycoside hydrolase family 32 [Penicillium chermesinum]|uniref:Glycoside hydrolase family 32 n=1 Tax=Penicillium chermesinum TaxID=63820 RepID=A0A9W9TXU0_9EURO|nr:Glycoside hydrolase family 32 [Penicillium chermesinum]KAJ5246908.1 Glycoside hydrolase family 32 [Penicillium chermesinum]
MSLFLGTPDSTDMLLHQVHPCASTNLRLPSDPKEQERILATKPSFHLIAPHGWLNDPCGLGYDPATGLYHLFFQWNPYGNDWGNMSWGHATSTDLVSWNQDQTPALTPSAEYDSHGVFTGCLRPTDIQGNPGSLTAIYTSVSHLPIHYTLPYVAGCESLGLVCSIDGGKTWKRQDCNPILPGPPSHLSVTGWRDPFVTTWARGQPSASQTDPPQLYGFLCGGISGKKPAVFVYTISPEDLRQWQYVGLLVDVDLNFRPSRWSGDLGVNWEVANLVTLCNDSGETREFLVICAEGCLPSTSESSVPDARSRRTPRGQMWMSINPSPDTTTADEALATYSFSGIFDHGCLYAASSFWDPETSQRIVYGWITEEDLPDGLRHKQGWSGMISLPLPEASGNTYTLHTLGISPDGRLSRLRQTALHSKISDLALKPDVAYPGVSLSLSTNRCEFVTEFSVARSCSRVGIEIAHSSDFEHRTTLSWDPQSETFIIDRPALQNPDINHGRESAPHTLFTLVDDQGTATEERLQIHAFFDKSVLEVFVNSRTVICTRVYYPSDRLYGIRYFAKSSYQDDHTPSTLVHAEVWDGLGV